MPSGASRERHGKSKEEAREKHKKNHGTPTHVEWPNTETRKKVAWAIPRGWASREQRRGGEAGHLHGGEGNAIEGARVGSHNTTRSRASSYTFERSGQILVRDRKKEEGQEKDEKGSSVGKGKAGHGRVSVRRQQTTER